MSRDILDNFLNGQLSTNKALITMSEPLAARVGSMDYEELVSDPALWSANLAKTGRLLDMDALVLGFAPEICLEDSKLSIALDAFDRLVQTESSYFGCIANMIGPFNMATKLLDDHERVAELKQKTVDIAEAFCKKRPDILIVREDSALGQNSIGIPQRKAFNTLKNMAAYFSVPLGLYLEDYKPAIVADLGKLKIPFIFFGPDHLGEAPSIDVLKQLTNDIDGIGLPIDFDNPEQGRAQAENYIKNLPGVNFIFTNLKELDRNTDLEAILALVSDLKSAGN